MLQSTKLNTFGMTNTIYRDLLCSANGGLSIDYGVVVKWLSIRLGNDCNPFVLVVKTSLKTLNVHIIDCETL